MIVQEIIDCIEHIAPLSTQESFDNSGLQTGNKYQEVTKSLICLDITKDVISEAIENKCDMIISHHPLIFNPLKKIDPATILGEIIYKAIQHNIAIYCAHTNLDNALNGVNAALAKQIGLNNTEILQKKPHQLKKLIVFCPATHSHFLKETLFAAGCGNIGNYSHCSFSTKGKGSFMPDENAHPFVGTNGEIHIEEEERIEVIFPFWKEKEIIQSLLSAHPYEEPAYDIIDIAQLNSTTGSGMVGELSKALDENEFLMLLKDRLNLNVIKHSRKTGTKVKRVAVCGGSGAFLINDALAAKADAFVTADIKYHDFFEKENRLFITDIGHFESEILATEIIFAEISKIFPKFALRKSAINTNSVFYYH